MGDIQNLVFGGEKMSSTFTIRRMGQGWYNFEALPQGYIRIHNLNCGTDSKAIRQAQKIAGKHNTYKIEEEGGKSQ